MFVNWGLEAYKWQFLISPLEKISFFKAFKGILAGVTVSIFMPNRMGEFAGRIFFLEKADKIEATLRNFIGSTMQFLITLITGCAALFICIWKGFNRSINIDFFDIEIIEIILIVILLIVSLFYLLNRFRNRFSEKFQQYLKSVFDTSKKDLTIVFTVSFLRYFVFLLQYYIVIRACGIHTDFITASVLIAITFLITSIVPSFALTEIATRGAAAAFLFASVTQNSTGIITASFIVWLINLAFPALIGSVFIWKLKLFK